MKEDRQRIFISAYACEPGLGSEIGVGWHWVLEMSQYYDLWVLTRDSNRHTIEPWIAEHPEFAGIHFLYFDLPKWARFWKKGLRESFHDAVVTENHNHNFADQHQINLNCFK